MAPGEKGNSYPWLSVEYFKKRAYYHGVCHSFSQIRAGQAPLSGKSQGGKVSLYRRMRGLAGTTLRRLQGRTSFWATDGAPIKKLTDQANWDGWLFHQREVAADPALRAWVRRENYFGTDIREESKK